MNKFKSSLHRQMSLVMMALFPLLLGFTTIQKPVFSDDYHPIWSPDSSKIIFDSNRQGGGIFMVDLESNAIQQITDKGSIYTNLSPDGKHLAFSSGYMDNLNIYSVDIEGKDLRLLISDSYNNIRPVWSPDSQKIAFQSTRDQSSIYVMNADGTDIRKVVDEATIGESIFTPSDHDANIWSPDSKQIIFITAKPGMRSVYVVDIDGSHLRRLIGPDNIWNATWSADGKWIAFWRKIGDQEGISIIDPDGNNLSPLESNAYSPLWAHEADWMAFLRNDSEHHKLVIGRLQLLNGGNVFRRTRSISVSEFRSIANYSWSPDQKYFAFAACVGDADIFVVNVTDESITNVTDETSLQPSNSICNGVG